MWYHWVAGIIVAGIILHAVYSFFTVKQTGIMFVAHSVGIVVGVLILRWAYAGITAPASLIGGRSR